MSIVFHKSGSLGRLRRLGLYIVGVGVWLSGGAWLLFHYFFTKQGEFGPVENSLTPWWLRLHGAFGFAAIWIFGLLWGTHISVTWPRRRRRWSGGVLGAVFALLIVSGYLLYYVGDDSIRTVISVLHWGIGLICPVFFLFHRIRTRKRRAQTAERAPVRP